MRKRKKEAVMGADMNSLAFQKLVAEACQEARREALEEAMQALLLESHEADIGSSEWGCGHHEGVTDCYKAIRFLLAKGLHDQADIAHRVPQER
jgi:hypothetical protein